MTPYPALLITDLDNTLYDFPSYYEAGLRALIHSLNERLCLDTETVIERLRSVYTVHGSIEYPFAIEEIPELHGLRLDTRRNIIRDALEAFWTSASNALILYPTVEETLKELRRQRIPVVAYTDAPIHEAMRRLRVLRIDSYITGLVAQQWFRRRPRRSFAIALQQVPGYQPPPRKYRIVWRVPAADRKPNHAVYSRIREEFNVDPEYVTVVGDSLARDLSPAIENGMQAMWALYGQRDGLAETEQLLMKVVPSRHPEVGITVQSEGSQATPITRFRDVLQVMPVQQVMWFDPSGAE